MPPICILQQLNRTMQCASFPTSVVLARQDWQRFAFFSVTARDEYKNLRQLHDDSWLAVIEVILRHRYFEILGF